MLIEGEKFPRLSKPVPLMSRSYDCVVIGSGYGGGVAASRLARTRKSVCLLERGSERWPGEYPVSAAEVKRQVHVSKEDMKGNEGDPTGMFHVVSGVGLNAVVGNGLGGTSLINANVFLKPEDSVLKLPAWPAEIREDPRVLNEYYRRAEEVLQPQTYPEDAPSIPKVQLLKKQAEYLGLDGHYKLVPQTTRFRDGPNSTGIQMSRSALSGQDCTGVNDGSKNSTLVTYVADAWNWGAEIFCECEVQHITTAPELEGGYLIYFSWHSHGRDRFQDQQHRDLLWVHARDCVFLGAGSIGTTEILLRSKDMGLKMSNQVGQRLSDNGDMISMGYNTDENVCAVGMSVPSPYKPVGPTTSAAIFFQQQGSSPLDNYTILDGAIPSALVPQMKTQIFLTMTHNETQTTMKIESGNPVLQVTSPSASDQTRRLHGLLGKATSAVGGTYVQNPFHALGGDKSTTLHPIGGACMFANGATGATNHRGEVFVGEGTETYDGLVIVDAALIPRTLGVSPLATITALAERNVQEYARRQGLSIDWKRNSMIDLFGSPANKAPYQDLPSGDVLDFDDDDLDGTLMEVPASYREIDPHVKYTEMLSGFVHQGPSPTYDQACQLGYSFNEGARLLLSMTAFNANNAAYVTGTFTCPTIAASPFVVRGHMDSQLSNLNSPGQRGWRYLLNMHGVDGSLLRFRGHKSADSSTALAPMKLWVSATTLHCTITNRRDSVFIAKGILTVQNSISEALSSVPKRDEWMPKKLWRAFQFASNNLQGTLPLLLPQFSALQYPRGSYVGYTNPSLPDDYVTITAQDGVATRLLVWQPSSRLAFEAPNILLVPGMATDHHIFALPTIEQNWINQLTEAGYRVFVLIHRIGPLMILAADWTTHDARLDVRAGLEHIRRQSGKYTIQKESYEAGNQVYIVAHGMGAMALAAGLLDGTIPASWVCGLTSSQTFMDPTWHGLGAGTLPGDTVYRAMAGSYINLSASSDDTIVQQAINQTLRFYPHPRHEMCNNASCHRISFVFGRGWNHANLNNHTHIQLDRFFGGVNMKMLNLLARQAREGNLLTTLFEKLDTPENIERLRGIPIMLFVGNDNAVVGKEGARRSYDRLCDAFGSRDESGQVQYRFRVIPGYGHHDCWMGKNACRDVYPIVLEEINRVLRRDDWARKQSL
ncbi:hypothetical protein B0T16DRAFT_424392 [Cercophora newfieldiana]|uniref:Cholesterol oxidase n=1 Tax=Cercophora newfieldiana TaxID=92897 RepID=A0AA40CYY0_9PEZI|nr:hypothetical protein B0T16DRAFT_424392 [Cercophora newfieldiana]